MSPPSVAWLALLIGAGALLALVRLVLWRKAAPSVERGPAWRLLTLVGLNVLAAALLYLTLDPPDVGVRSGHLVVLTAGAPADLELESGDIVAALPEALDTAGGRVPDLATALRRHPEVEAIRVLGMGLTARDRIAVDRAVEYALPATPVGLLRLTQPPPVAPGGSFAVSGEIGALVAGTVELADPSGTIVDRASVTAGAGFVLKGTARAAGLALFELRLKDRRGQIFERIDIPLEAREVTPPRVIVMAGAPGPEPRFLRRWAEQAGIDLSVQLSLGAGVDLTARPAPLTATSLAATDLLVIDERRWETLGGVERAAIRSAVSTGMGLLFRPTGPLSDTTRRDWAALGAPLTGGENLRPVILDDTPARVEGSPVSGEVAGPFPELSRRDFAPVGSGAVVLLEDEDGAPLATWRPFGEGRVGVWIVADSYALVLTGQRDRYGDFWSRMFSTLARAEGATSPRLVGPARAGDRAHLCGLTGEETVMAPDGTRTRPVVDPRAGPTLCGAFWPRRTGWHAILVDEVERGLVYVHPAGATPSLSSAETMRATRDLSQSITRSPAARGARRSPGSSWPWFGALVLVLGGLWALERSRPEITVADR